MNNNRNTRQQRLIVEIGFLNFLKYLLNGQNCDIDIYGKLGCFCVSFSILTPRNVGICCREKVSSEIMKNFSLYRNIYHVWYKFQRQILHILWMTKRRITLDDVTNGNVSSPR